MNDIMITNDNLPMALKQRFDAEKEKSNEIASGVESTSFLPRLSIKGKEFTIISGTQKRVLTTPYVDVIIVDARKNVSKLYYENPFDPNAQAGGPDCASIDGITPDFVPAIVDKETNKCPKNCKNCYFNQFGTALQGKGKACKDYKRLVIMFAGTENAEFNPSLPPLTFDLPGTSFKAPVGTNATMFNEFVEQCRRNNFPISGVVVRLSFMPGVAFSQVVMQAVRVVTEEEYNRVLELRETEEVISALKDKYNPDSIVDNDHISDEVKKVDDAKEEKVVVNKEKEEKKVVKKPSKEESGELFPGNDEDTNPKDEKEEGVDQAELAALKELEALLGE